MTPFWTAPLPGSTPKVGLLVLGRTGTDIPSKIVPAMPTLQGSADSTRPRARRCGQLTRRAHVSWSVSGEAAAAVHPWRRAVWRGRRPRTGDHRFRRGRPGHRHLGAARGWVRGVRPDGHRHDVLGSGRARRRAGVGVLYRLPDRLVRVAPPRAPAAGGDPVSYTHLRAHETVLE